MGTEPTDFDRFLLELLHRLLPQSGQQTEDRVILDLGCGDGRLMEILAADGFRAVGCEMEGLRSAYESALFERFGPGWQDLVIFSTDENTLPYADSSVDAIVSTSVLEHVSRLDDILAETTRILKPNGVAFHTFPYKTAVIEPHIKVPMVHWFPHGRIRRVMLVLAGAAKGHGLDWTRATNQDDYLNRMTHFVGPRRFRKLALKYFGEVKSVRRDFGGYRLSHHAGISVRPSQKLASNSAVAGALRIIKSDMVVLTKPIQIRKG